LIGATISIASVATATAAAPASVAIANLPRHAVAPPFGVHSTWSASNWSGYAETGTYTGVTSTWTVPAVGSSSSPTYSSVWIGIDGFNNSSLIQTGTEEDYYNGSAHYNAWWEILPAAETALPTQYAVAKGDRMSASIYETSTLAGTLGHGARSGTQHVWDIKITDQTKGWTFSTAQPYNGAGSSAEWIVEAPQVGGRIATLARYSFTGTGIGTAIGDFDNAGIQTGIVGSGSPSYTSAALKSNESGVMVQNGAVVSTPSTPDSPATAFNAKYGPTAPGAPTT
jgi:hypothetical protein